ncbi:MAG: peptide/nickel transport system substrate-binding protein [Methylobacteriaceae bacterium]|nr:peptide/nickel transport system substrate-binding protein [Methylobacteriaceae bacterium]
MLRTFGNPLRYIGCLFVLAAAILTGPQNATAQDKKVLRVVMHSGLRITDPIITTAYIARNHGYMIYDTLFATDENFKIQPQMVKDYSVSNDKLTYTFTCAAD